MASKRRKQAGMIPWTTLGQGSQRLLTALVVHPGAVPQKWITALGCKASDIDALNRVVRIQKIDTKGWALEGGMDPSTIPWEARDVAHRTLARLCQSVPSLLAVAAHHWEAVGEEQESACAWISAARHAAEKGELTETEHFLEKAFSLAPQWSERHWIACSDFLEFIGREPDLAIRFAQQVARLVQTQEAAARVLPWLANVAFTQRRHVEAAEMRRKAAWAMSALGDPAGAARELTSATMALAFAQFPSTAAQASEEAVRNAEVSKDPLVLVQALTAHGLALGASGKTALGHAALERGLDLALRHRFTGAAATLYHLIGTVNEYASCYGDQLGAFAKALTYCRRHDQTEAEALCLGCLSYALFRAGNWSRARTIAEKVLALPKPPDISICVATGVLGLFHAHRGERREALTHLDRCLEYTTRTGILALMPFIHWGRALVEEAEADGPAGWHYQNLIDHWRSTEDRHDAIPGLSAAAAFYGERKDAVALRRVRDALHTIAGAVLNPEAHGGYALARAEMQWMQDGASRAVPTFEEALAYVGQRSLVPERVRILLRLGAALVESQDHTKARSLLVEARDTARRLGARHWQANAVELLRCSEKPNTEDNRAQDDAWNGLSPRQREVARHLCRGASNKEIASDLGLSVRTIDMHVAHVLNRMNCRSRMEAAARMSALLG